MAPTPRCFATTSRGTTSFISLLIITVLLLTTATAHALTTATLWSQRFGSTGQDMGMATAVDALGNLYVAGYFSGTVDFGGGPLTSAGTDDIFVARYNSMGVHQWSQRFGSTGSDEAYGISVDAGSIVCVTGYFSNTVDFGGGSLVSAGGSDIFVLRLTSSGAYYSSQRFGSTGMDVGYSVAIDGEYGFVVAGSFNNTVDFGGGPLTSAGGNDIFLAYYTSGMSLRWAKQLGGTGNDVARRMVIDGPAHVLFTGEFAATVDFGGGPLTSAGGQDGFVAEYDYDGNHVWSRRFGDTGTDRGYGVTVDQFANVLVCGNFQGTADFGGGNLTSAGIYDAFLVKYDTMGAHQWSHRFGSTTNDIAYALATDASDNVILTGYFSGSVDFGAGVMVNAGGVDLFVAKYNAAGVCQWSQRHGGTYDERGRSLATDVAGNVFAMGDFNGTVDFGTGDLANAGSSTTWDVFLMKLTGAVAEPVISDITDIGNDQGRKVKVRFSRAGADDRLATIPVTRYAAFRRDDPPPAVSTQGLSGKSTRELLASGWTEVGSVGAYGEATYGIDVPTIGDSTIALGQYLSTFHVRAVTDAPTRFYDSPSAAGYSLDNLAPGAPQNFAYAAGQLSWKESSAEDFDYFTVYGSNTDSYLRSRPWLTTARLRSLDVSGSPYVFYFVTATDFSGNEGKPAKVNTLSGVGGTPKSYVLSVSNYPNPFNPRTTVSYTVPSRGRSRSRSMTRAERASRRCSTVIAAPARIPSDGTAAPRAARPSVRACTSRASSTRAARVRRRWCC